MKGGTYETEKANISSIVLVASFSVGCLGIINNVISAQAVNPEEIVAISSNGDVLDLKLLRRKLQMLRILKNISMELFCLIYKLILD